MPYFPAILMLAFVLIVTPALGQGGGEMLKQGEEVYEKNCADCHRSNGEGLPVKFPALRGNPFVTGDAQAVVELVLNGRKGKLGQMPAWKDFLDDVQIAQAISYIRNAWGNKAAVVQPQDVGKLRRY